MNNNSYLCNFIQKNDNWRELLSSAPYSINIKEDGKYAIFNYNMIDNPDFFLPEVQEARGIILDIEKLDVVCWPFRKFGNYGEPYVDDIDWSTARVQEKVDGSIIKVWWYGDHWQVSSNSALNLDNTSDYCKLFESIFDAYDKLDKDYTYIFELVSPDTTVVIFYDKAEIYHIGTRNNKTGQEVNFDIGIQKPKEYELNSLDGCINAAASLNEDNNIQHEGFVVVDGNWNRVKIKSPMYVAAHHLRSNPILTPSRIYDIIAANEKAEFLSYFPHQKDKFDKFENDVMEMFNHIADVFIYCEKECKEDKVKFILNNVNEDDKWIAWQWKAGKAIDEVMCLPKTKFLKLVCKE